MAVRNCRSSLFVAFSRDAGTCATCSSATIDGRTVSLALGGFSGVLAVAGSLCSTTAASAGGGVGTTASYSFDEVETALRIFKRDSE